MIGFVVGGMLSTGCAVIGLSEPQISDKPRRTIREEVPQEAKMFTDLKQDGMSVEVRIAQACDIREDQEVLRTERAEVVNKTPGLDWLLVGLGAGAAALGTAVVMDASNVYPNDPNSRTYNPTGPTGARIGGAALIGGGAAMLTVPVVDVFRAQGTKENAYVARTNGPTVQRGIACSKRPLPGRRVEVRHETATWLAGKTDKAGTLRVDLDQVVPSTEELKADAKASVVLAGATLGTVELAPVFKQRFEASWKQLDRKACEEPTTSTSCDSVKAFAERYPGTAEANEASRIYEMAAPKLKRLAEEEAWKKGDVKACAEAEEEIEPCKALREYVERFPEGEHVKEAEAALKQMEAREKAAAVRARAEWIAEQARMQAEERREAAREAAAKRQKCNALCQVSCSRRLHPGMCMSGCTKVCMASDSVQ